MEKLTFMKPFSSGLYQDTIMNTVSDQSLRLMDHYSFPEMLHLGMKNGGGGRAGFRGGAGS
jgi:hypothetical protein